MILKILPDLITLNNLIEAFPGLLAPLYQNTYKDLLSGKLRRQYPLETQKLISTVINVRNLPDFTLVKDWEQHLHLRIKDPQGPLVIDHLTHPISALQAIVKITQVIEH